MSMPKELHVENGTSEPYTAWNDDLARNCTKFIRADHPMLLPELLFGWEYAEIHAGKIWHVGIWKDRPESADVIWGCGPNPRAAAVAAIEKVGV